MLSIEEKKAVIKYRIEKAYKTYEEAQAVAKMGYWNLTGNRLYYSVYHMLSALMLDKGFTARTHAGIIHLLGEKFILTGLLDRAYGRFVSRLFELRQAGDYDDLFDATKEEVMPYFEKTQHLLEDLRRLITLI